MKELDRRKCIVTVDAMNVQKETVQVIVQEAHGYSALRSRETRNRHMKKPVAILPVRIC